MTDDINDVPTDDFRMPGEDSYGRHQPNRRPMAPADYRDRIAELESRVDRLEIQRSDAAGVEELAAKLSYLESRAAREASLRDVAARLGKVEIRVAKAAKVVQWILGRLGVRRRQSEDAISRDGEPQPAGSNGTPAPTKR